jgi:parallel beta-helix repeat protein
MLIRARQPNYGGTGNEYNEMAASSSKLTEFVVSAEDKSFIGSKDIVGATVYIRTAPWKAEARDISVYNSTTGFATFVKLDPSKLIKEETYFNLVDTLFVPPEKGAGYLFEGKPWMLDSEREWHYDPTTKVLSVWLPGGVAPAMNSIEVMRRTRGILVGTFSEIKGVTKLKIEKLALRGFRYAPIDINGGNNITITDIDSRQNAKGILLTAGARNTVEKSYFEENYGNGVHVMGKSPYAIIRDNTVVDTGMKFKYSAISGIYIAAATNTLVQGNTVLRSGWAGISLWSTTTGSVIEDNYIEKTCQRFGDCGAIYTSIGFVALPVTDRLVIRNNFVTNTGKNMEGVVGPNEGYGLYLDTVQGNTDLLNNMVSNTDGAYIVHGGSNNTLKGNVIWDQKSSGGLYQDRTGVGTYTQRGNVNENNYYFMHSSSLPTVSRWHLYSQTTSEFLSGTRPNTIKNNAVISKFDTSLLRWNIISKGVWIAADKLADWLKIEPTLRLLSPTDAFNEIEAGGYKKEWVDRLRAEF